MSWHWIEIDKQTKQTRAVTNDYFDNWLVGQLFFRLIGLKKNILCFYFIDKKHYSTFFPMSFKQTCQLNDIHTVLNLLDQLS